MVIATIFESYLKLVFMNTMKACTGMPLQLSGKGNRLKILCNRFFVNGGKKDGR